MAVQHPLLKTVPRQGTARVDRRTGNPWDGRDAPSGPWSNFVKEKGAQMEMVLVAILFALGVVGILLIRVARRMYGRPHQPGESKGAEHSFIKSLLVQPPPKPPSPYTLSRRPAPPEATQRTNPPPPPKGS